MSESYTKLSSGIINSTIWREDAETCKLWITMLALKDAEGIVRCAVPNLADHARIPLGKCVEALQKFQEPDPYSQTKDFEGKRIKQIEGGWLILNHEKFQTLGWSDEKKRFERERKQRYRAARAPKPRRTAKQVRAESESRERRYVEAADRGDEAGAERIAAEGLPPKGPLSATLFADLEKELNELYRRGADDRWSYAEQNRLNELLARPKIKDELREIVGFYNTLGGDRKYFPQQLARLLQDWESVLDRARMKRPRKSKAPPVSAETTLPAKPYKELNPDTVVKPLMDELKKAVT